jgi:hypothetical protein
VLSGLACTSNSPAPTVSRARKRRSHIAIEGKNSRTATLTPTLVKLAKAVHTALQLDLHDNMRLIFKKEIEQIPSNIETPYILQGLLATSPPS